MLAVLQSPRTITNYERRRMTRSMQALVEATLLAFWDMVELYEWFNAICATFPLFSTADNNGQSNSDITFTGNSH